MNGLKTPLFEKHKALKGNMVLFGGYLLPTHYTSINHEHQVVRSKAGLFDVSHMGEFIVSGSDAESFLQSITINDVSIIPNIHIIFFNLENFIKKKKKKMLMLKNLKKLVFFQLKRVLIKKIIKKGLIKFFSL